MSNQEMTDRVADDTQSDYQRIKSHATRSMQRGVWTDRFDCRFVPFADREMRCDLPREAVDCISRGKHYASYRGWPMAKDPLDLSLYQTLFYEIQPRTIIELGAYTGASALWMADNLQMLKIPADVIAVDIDLTLVDPQLINDPRIQFLQGDCHAIEEILPAARLDELAHPLVLIDDAHVNVDGVYRHFHNAAFQSGDYLIIEDTIPWIPGVFGEAESEVEWGDWKWNELREFFAEHVNQYRVDRYYTDFYGYNATWNWNGFVKRV